MRLAFGDALHGFLNPSLSLESASLRWHLFLKRHLIGLLEAVPDCWQNKPINGDWVLPETSSSLDIIRQKQQCYQDFYAPWCLFGFWFSVFFYVPSCGVLHYDVMATLCLRTLQQWSLLISMAQGKVLCEVRGIWDKPGRVATVCWASLGEGYIQC